MRHGESECLNLKDRTTTLGSPPYFCCKCDSSLQRRAERLGDRPPVSACVLRLHGRRAYQVIALTYSPSALVPARDPCPYHTGHFKTQVPLESCNMSNSGFAAASTCL